MSQIAPFFAVAAVLCGFAAIVTRLRGGRGAPWFFVGVALFAVSIGITQGFG